jgi:hypothetical protein
MKILPEELKEFKLLLLSCNATFSFIGGQLKLAIPVTEVHISIRRI